MERSQEYEPLILDLQKSQSVQRPQRLVFMSLMAVAVVSLLTAGTFAVFYLIKPPIPQPTPILRDLPTATPGPETMVTETPPEEVAVPTPEPVVIPIPLPTATPQIVETVPPVTASPAVTPMPGVTPTPVFTPTPSVPETGFLTLYSAPDNAEVVIDGKVLGRTPLQQYELPVGTYTVKFTHEGKVSAYRLTITAGATTEYTHHFQGFASLRIRMIPSDSSVYLNGELAGQGSPLEIGGLLAGTYTISVRKPGYASAEKTVVLEKEGRQEILMTLRRLGISGDNDKPSATPLPQHPSERLQEGN